MGKGSNRLNNNHGLKNMRLLNLLIVVLLLGGCATAPDVMLGYYLPKADVKTTATQVITCKKITAAVGQTGYSIERDTSFDITPIYSSDTSKTYYVNPSELGSWFTDSEFKLNYTEGGRMSQIKAKVTGKGKEVVDLTAQALSLFAKSTEFYAAKDNDKAQFDACETINARVKGDLKQVFVKYTHVYNDSSGANITEIEFKEPILQSTVIKFSEIEALTSDPKIAITAGSQPEPMHVYKSKCESLNNAHTKYSACLAENAEIALKQPKPFKFNLIADNKAIERTVFLPQHGKLFTLPLPTGTLFGVNDADISFNPDGTVSSITYNTQSDLEGVGKLVSEVKGDSETDIATEEAKLFKAQADALYQAKRLRACQDAPSTCSDK